MSLRCVLFLPRVTPHSSSACSLENISFCSANYIGVVSFMLAVFWGHYAKLAILKTVEKCSVALASVELSVFNIFIQIFRVYFYGNWVWVVSNVCRGCWEHSASQDCWGSTVCAGVAGVVQHVRCWGRAMCAWVAGFYFPLTINRIMAKNEAVSGLPSG